MKAKFLSILVAITLFGSRAFADTVSSTDTFTGVALGGATDNFTLNGFDSSLGTLTGVTLTLNLTTTSNFTIYNNNSGSWYVNFAEDTFSTVLIGPDSTTEALAEEALWNTEEDVPSGTTTLSTHTETYEGSTTVPPIGANISQYISSSPLNFSLATPDSLAGGGLEIENGDASLTLVDENFNALYTDLSSGTVTVTYTYTPNEESATPEPSTWALLLGGVGLLVYWQRRPARDSEKRRTP